MSWDFEVNYNTEMLNLILRLKRIIYACVSKLLILSSVKAILHFTETNDISGAYRYYFPYLNCVQ